VTTSEKTKIKYESYLNQCHMDCHMYIVHDFYH